MTAEPGSRDEAPLGDAPLADAFGVDAAEVRRAMEYYADKGWTDGLPVVPVTESYLTEFLAVTSRDPATIGWAIRLGAINGLGLRPHVLDQATQGTPAKYACCIGENEEDSPWPPLHAGHGFRACDSAVAVRIVVAGAPNAGVSSIVETFTRLDGPPAFGKVEPPPSPA